MDRLSWEGPEVTQRFSSLLAGCLFFSACLTAAPLRGTVVDPSGAPISGAEISVMDRVGVQQQTLSATNGVFAVRLPDPLPAGWRLVVTAPGFATGEVRLDSAASPLTVELALAPVVDSVRVAGSAIDVAASQQAAASALFRVRRSGKATCPWRWI